jgi:hypothetical protein
MAGQSEGSVLTLKRLSGTFLPLNAQFRIIYGSVSQETLGAGRNYQATSDFPSKPHRQHAEHRDVHVPVMGTRANEIARISAT